MTADDEELAKDLGLLSALTIGVGTMIGAGIFVLPGQAAAAASPAVALSFVAGGVISLFTALSASELEKTIIEHLVDRAGIKCMSYDTDIVTVEDTQAAVHDAVEGYDTI